MRYAIARVEETHDRIVVPSVAATSGTDALRQFRAWLFENNPQDMDGCSGVRGGRLFVRGNLYIAGELRHKDTCGQDGEGGCNCLPDVLEDYRGPEPDGFRMEGGRIVSTSR